MEFKIREMNREDWNQVAEIYYEGIKTEKVTFQSTVPTYEEWDNGHIKSCRLVAYAQDKILGWASLGKYSDRCVYAGIADVSIYIGDNYKKMGIGTELLKQLIILSEENNFWSLQSVIIEENIGSIKLHEKLGFRKIGYKEKIGKMKNGKWHNLVLMELRSKVISNE